MVKDPVCGMDVNESEAAATSQYKDKTYYFCSVPCKESFDKNPEKYSGQDTTDSEHHHHHH